MIVFSSREFASSPIVGNFSTTNECGVHIDIAYPELGNLRETWYAVLNSAKNAMSLIKVAEGDDISGTMGLMPSAACSAATIKGRYSFASTFAYRGAKNAIATSNYIGEEYYDGVNKFFGLQSLGTVSPTSPILRQTFNGSYTVSSDCTVVEQMGYFQIIMADLSQWYISINAANGFDFGWSPKGLA